MPKFTEEYKKLNAEQRQAVDTVEGPMLVVAGPGTGKTQLLSLRVANIIRQTDTPPANILCLTFTDNAARNMRERLETIIGQAAYHVNIHTFHSFGADIINHYPDYFLDRELIQQIDELGSYELLRSIFKDLPHGNPLGVKVGEEYIMLKDSLSIISWLKQNALTPTEFRHIITANQKFMDKLSDELTETFAARPSPAQLPAYGQLLKNMQAEITGRRLFGFPEYALSSATEFAAAIEAVNPASRYAPSITAWRNTWAEKNTKGEHVFKDHGRNTRKLLAVAAVYERLLARMREQGLYDFDDMIVEAVHAMEKYDDLRANLQERYLYILVDEFQDTNKAQLRMLEALGDNPIFENRPNIMAVGDDDQAIYAFQGAEVSNMVAFANLYREPVLVTLADNYRSTESILSTSFSVAEQITDRLGTILPDTHKHLRAMNNSTEGIVSHTVLPSELAQYQWVAEQVKDDIKKGIQPEEIAIIAPRHKYLERLIPYLAEQDIPVAYERRENILEAPIIKQLLQMAKLVVAITKNKQGDVDALLGEVIQYEFWGITADDLLSVSIQCYDKHAHWLPTLSSHKNKSFQHIAGWFQELARHSTTEPLEYVLDTLMGVQPTPIDEESGRNKVLKKAAFISPMRTFYFSRKTYDQATDTYLAVLGQLSTLRHRLRQWKPDQALYIEDLVHFAQLHNEAHLKIIDTNPHTQTTNAVQVMTAYKAKGLEFTTVFVLNAQDEVWGPTSRSRAMRISLPKNLPLAPASDGENDKLRLLFVALTRSKRNLIITSYTHTLENKLSPGLSFIGGNNPDTHAAAGALRPKLLTKPPDTKAVEILATDWAYRFRDIIADKPTLFEPILANYKLSVTHLNNFTDVLEGGPQYFFIHNLLRFPQALIPSAAYGDAIHKTLHWADSSLKDSDQMPRITKIKSYFSDMLGRLHLRESDYIRLNKRGRDALAKYFDERGTDFRKEDLVERGFNNEGVVINEARLSGKVDKIRFEDPGNLVVIDFKTGKPAGAWTGKDEYEKVKLHKYRQQLLFYKLLVENSASFKGKAIVTHGALEFIEANEQGTLIDNLLLTFDEAELKRFINLIGAIWQHIMALNMPAVSQYDKSLKGIRAFEDDLISGAI